MSDIRDTITKELRWNFFGPDHTDSEEELLHLNRLEREDPGRVYITGLLSPQLNTTEDEESQDDSPFSKTGANDSSFGLTFCLPNNFSGKVEYGVDFSHYENEKIDEVETFIRKPHTHVFSFDLDMIKEGNKIENEVFKIDKKEHEIKLILTRRTDISNPSGIMFTLSIVHFGKVESSLRPWRSTLFHVRVWTRYKDGKFSELPFQSLDLTEDKKRASLLYRNVHRFAVGHGCGVNWNSSAPVEIESTFFPEVEVPLYKHADLETEALSMIKWAGVGMDFELLKNIPDSYSKWLDSQERISENLPNDLLLTFQKNKKEVEYVLTRIKKGIDIIIGNPLAQKAFLWMNYVMLSQQIRSKLKVIPVVNENGDPTPGNSLDFDVLDMDSWPIENKERLGRWRLFQMAFILMCIPDIVEDEKEPNMDLIWFPTGGGKTEAYLGLSAFLLLYERLTGKNNKGVRVIMRYTLRLLTAQQFERAAAMILALDDLRFSNSSELGDVPFQIGLWVGGAVTFNKNGSIPNNWTREVTTANQWYSNLNYQYPNRSWPWVLQKCPRCSREFGVKGKGDNKKAFGISRTNENKVIYSCECSNYKNNRLPIVVIDEDIYEELPAIVIATVDKFARLSWNSLSSKILGVNALGDKKHSQVSMIIQDELHLLEGPLGTIVGLYETAIDRLIQRTGANPKRIGSSATLAMAHEQCNSLYGLPPENVKIFPPPLLNWDDNYFSYVEKGVDGRKYVGVYANGSPSHKTTQYRLFSSLQQSGGKAAIEDPINNESFSTLVNYFNSTKDMGHALSLMGDDVPREMRNLFRRFNIPKDKRRSSIDINLGLVQLHGNIDSDTVQRDMSRLLIPYNNKGHVHTVLATNMISVGLDVPRLSLMTIQHQPKTMSEYIQASSRIGRGKTPGVVYVVLSALRSRDRSHLEDFKHTHEKMYSLVEPSSLTPFSTSALERALAGVLVAIFRNDPMEGHFGEFAPLKQKHIKDVREFYIKRVSAVDKKELNNFLEKFDSFCRSWNRDGYRSFGKERNINLANSPLMVPFLTPMDVRNSKPYQVLSAMRNVDSGIELKQMQ
jgi:hypothetical protein